MQVFYCQFSEYLFIAQQIIVGKKVS